MEDSMTQLKGHGINGRHSDTACENGINGRFHARASKPTYHTRQTPNTLVLFKEIIEC